MNDQNTKSDNDKPSSRLNFNYPVPDNQQSQSQRKTIRRSRPAGTNVQPAVAAPSAASSPPPSKTAAQPRAVSAPSPENQISSPPAADAPATEPVKKKLLRVWPFGR
ncbi:MAG TPA: hypothetical protein VMR08_00175 [Patescibacteria group bacterium]|jgi:hypothetical protein|nr:hypothetical protein [Patescibacteria group bacterium]